MILLSIEWIFRTVDPLFLIMLVVLVFLIFTMFRRNKKAQADAQKRKSSMAPGQEVMTSYGLFGTIVSVDNAENKVVLELSPGNTATVHLQSVTKIVDPVEPATAETAVDALPAEPTEATVVEPDRDILGSGASPATSSTGRPATGTSSTGTPAGRPETPEETLRRLEQQNENNNR